ncbi:Ypt/Rab-GAP domain of gyp1p superfamily protein [Arabidopsis thaliana]|uniref:Ypt/Rab-GAP domain of gyp1p superfamily protein n=1 Tax=Arabidopsis thaliana TaxID=3702 RepID=F4IUX8_ARATH|nr:Ypt/Rab-GAP domain of gyp1p superfamily protein [Arabidopsis thaliana]AEC09653.1 Ypt/Rab-GAP domain of gyp1p superfamily protein [Arabidopsis thaliana]|eukprot:NP_181460.3 Ypt/Rab-GAP domain of gyp1p superfamily protein [Arabidopsis thaliana]
MIADAVSKSDHKRDAYGFSVRPQHVQRYREYVNIYKEEEVERSARWSNFLEFHAESGVSPTNGSSENTHVNPSESDKKKEKELNKGAERKDLNADKPGSDLTPGNAREEDEVPNREKNVHKVQLWAEIRPSLQAIEDLMSVRVKMKGDSTNGEQEAQKLNSLASTDETESSKGVCENDSEDEFYDAERSDPIQDGSSDGTSVSSMSAAADAASLVSACPWKDELEVLIHGGAPMALRGELWQAFAGVKKRRVKNYYQNLLAADSLGNDIEQELMQHTDEKGSSTDPLSVVEKWKGQIEKDLPRTFPGHPALDDDFRNALRRLLTAYARHNPSVGYCQAMNFFAALLLLLMPEENAFWSLTGIIDDYFHDYYSEEMLESQVDQRVLEELLRERFPKLVHHLDYLGVQVACVTGPWFLTIFINMLPWESVLRVWDVLLFEGNRVMLFRTALALMEFYGPALVTTKDIGDAVTLLQSMTGSTFDSSQLVFTACMGYQNVHESKLQELRSKHRPAVIAAFEERLKGLQAWRDSKDTATKLHNSKQDPNSVLASKASLSNGSLSRSESGSSYADDIFISLTGDCEIDIFQDLQGQVLWLKGELHKLLQEKRSALLRAEELEVALMEMVKQDNRRQLKAKIEQLEQGVTELRRLVSDKREQESAMIQVLMRMEQEHKVTEDARRLAEQDAATQRYAAEVLQEKYEEAVAALAEMEERAVMAESMLEATLQYQSGQVKAQPSPRQLKQDLPVMVSP